MQLKQAAPIIRAETEEFIQMADFLFPYDREKAVAALMRSTPRRAARVLTCQVPVHVPARDKMRALVDQLERLDRNLLDYTDRVVIVRAAGMGPGETIQTRLCDRPIVRTLYPWGELMPGDWFWVHGSLAGSRNVWISAQLQNKQAQARIWSYQYLLGGTRVDRLP